MRVAGPYHARGDVAFGGVSMSNVPDKNQIIDAKAAALRATLDRSKAAVAVASRELERHHLWVERHRALYTELLEDCQQSLKRRLLISTWKQTVLLPMQLLASACVAGFHWAWAYLHRFRLRAELQSRINAMEQLSRRRLPQAPSRTAAGPSTQTNRMPVHHSQSVKPRTMIRSISASG
jgi:hypothetical protein